MKRKQYVTAKCRYLLPFEIPMLEGSITQDIHFGFDGAQVTIYPPTFADSVGGELSELTRPEEHTLDFFKRAFGHSEDKVIFKTNLIPMDIVKEINDLTNPSDIRLIFREIAEAVLRRFLEICRYRTGNTGIE